MRLRALTLVLALAAATAVAPSHAVPLSGKSKPIYTQSVIETFHVPMRDGNTLFVEIKRPVVPDGVKVPVILTLSPYNIIESSALPPDVPTGGKTNHDTLGQFFVPRGYARAIADLRGHLDSTGCWDYGGVTERHDAYDIVQWLGGEDVNGNPSPTAAWTNGKVAMIGGSYDGTTANEAAVEQPSHLATIVPIAAIDRWYDYAYLNGVRWFANTEVATDEGIDTPLTFDFGFAIVPPIDPRASTYPEAVTDRYTPCDQVDHTTHGYNPQPDYDQFWVDRDYRALASNITIPVLIAHGLDDYNVKVSGGIEMFKHVSGFKHMVLAQISHAEPTSIALSSWQAELHRWFDQTLLDLDTGIYNDPPIEVQDTNNKWHFEQDWPSTDATNQVLSLRSDGALGDQESTQGQLSFVDDPTLTEERMMTTTGDPADVVFAGPTVSSSVRITGEPHLKLTFASDMSSTHLAAFLADVDSAGNYTRISRGYLNARYRDGLTVGKDLTAGTQYEANFDLTAADHILAAGHHVSLVVSSSSLLWALPDLARATNTIFTGPIGSELTLKVI